MVGVVVGVIVGSCDRGVGISEFSSLSEAEKIFKVSFLTFKAFFFFENIPLFLELEAAVRPRLLLILMVPSVSLDLRWRFLFLGTKSSGTVF